MAETEVHVTGQVSVLHYRPLNLGEGTWGISVLLAQALTAATACAEIEARVTQQVSVQHLRPASLMLQGGLGFLPVGYPAYFLLEPVLVCPWKEPV